MNGCWCLRLAGLADAPFALGDNKSGFEVTSCNVLPRDLALRSVPSFGGGIGRRCRDELADRIESFSIGGGGEATSGESSCECSGNPGRSVRTRSG
jgi:hypothetical protein